MLCVYLFPVVKSGLAVSKHEILLVGQLTNSIFSTNNICVLYCLVFGKLRHRQTQI